MVDPITGSAIAGGVMSYKGQRAAGKAAAQAAEHNRQVAENEAVLLARQKREEESRIRRQHRQLAGAQLVTSAASGIVMSGSALDAMADSYFSMEKDAAMIQYASTIEQTKSISDQAMMSFEGEVAQRTANINAMSSLLGGVSTAASNYDSMSGGELGKKFYG